jgi:hypothetical protein
VRRIIKEVAYDWVDSQCLEKRFHICLMLLTILSEKGFDR